MTTKTVTTVETYTWDSGAWVEDTKTVTTLTEGTLVVDHVKQTVLTVNNPRSETISINKALLRMGTLGLT